MIEDDRGDPVLLVRSARLDAVRGVGTGDPSVRNGESGLRIHHGESSCGINLVRRHDAIVRESPGLRQIERGFASHAY
jgi:hypothetical protein